MTDPRPIPLHLTSSTVARVDALVPVLGTIDEIVIISTPKRNTVMRLAMLRGVAEAEAFFAEHPIGSATPTTAPEVSGTREYRRNTVRVTLRLPAFLIDRLDALVAPFAHSEYFQFGGLMTRATVMRITLGRGLRKYEAEHTDVLGDRSGPRRQVGER